MKPKSLKRGWLALLGASVVLALVAGPAKAATEPLFVLIPTPPAKPPIVPPPTGYLNGPCGVGVDSTVGPTNPARFYVSDYYHHAIDLFSAAPNYGSQLSNVDPLGGPCGLALDASNNLYVNNYHRNVVKYNAAPSFGSGTVITGAGIDSSRPTGVAVSQELSTVYVNNRTYISAFDSLGNPVMDGPEPLKIGVGTLADGHGLAISQYSGTLGRLYVPDASTNTVKVYDPGTDKVNPIAEIKDPFGKPFVSLRDSAIAVDRVTGEVYFADNTQPKHTERPRATIYIFGPTGTFKGYLKYQVVDALQPGIAVDNSDGTTQGRVYVTSGNTSQAGIYAYGPGSGTFGTPLPPSFGLSVSTSGAGSGSVVSTAAKLDCESACERQLLSGGEVILTAAPEPGSTFTGWLGDCSGSTPTCAVTMDEAASVSATFTPASSTNAEQPSSGGSTTLSFPASAAVAPRQRGRRHRAKRRNQGKHRKKAGRRHRAVRRR